MQFSKSRLLEPDISRRACDFTPYVGYFWKTSTIVITSATLSTSLSGHVPVKVLGSDSLAPGRSLLEGGEESLGCDREILRFPRMVELRLRSDLNRRTLANV